MTSDGALAERLAHMLHRLESARIALDELHEKIFREGKPIRSTQLEPARCEGSSV
jgi:hypothetical protein